jgi:hypothetical protein
MSCDEPAFMSAELDLTEAERAGARLDYVAFGPPDEETLVRSLKRGADPDVILAVALGLPMDKYRDIEADVAAQPKPKKGWRH